MGDHHKEHHNEHHNEHNSGHSPKQQHKKPAPVKKSNQKQPLPPLEVDEFGLTVLPKREPKIGIEELRKENVAQAYRDFCAHLLVPLNRCRYDNLFLPSRCQHEKHLYEQCVYEDYLLRLEEVKRDKIRKQHEQSSSAK